MSQFINPNLAIQDLAKSFKIDKRLKIENFLQQDIAERVRKACLNHIPFSLHYVLDDKYQSKTREELAKMTQQETANISKRVISEASKGIGFLYEGYLKSRVNKDSNQTINEELAFLHQIFDYMGSEEVLNIIKQITGNQELKSAEPQYTRYTPGHFLTRHLDVVPGQERRYAFVLGLTQNWHPDWGGLLQFYEKDGTPRDAWTPQFNVMSIFEVSHVHSVTYVTPFATEPRISLTGWFTAKE